MTLTPEHPGARLTGRELRVGYERRTVLDDLDVAIPDHSFTVIVGPNACGKSTLLRTLARMLTPARGSVLLDGEELRRMPAKAVARRLGLLPQQAVVPDGITVRDLVGRGRHPHHGLLRTWSPGDEAAVNRAMTQAQVHDLADRFVDELSGGQRQRVWLALVLAQETELLLLDEPTTFLDLPHQVEVLDLCAELHERHGRTLVAVLHDVSQAARYATHLIAMRDGAIIAQGPPSEIVDEALIESVYDMKSHVMRDPVTGTPLVLPLGRGAWRAG